jgi:alanine racemase
MTDALSQLASPAAASCWREISLSAIIHNYRAVRVAVGPAVKIFACLKNDAYGCGAAEVAAVLAAEGVDGFGVASARDAYRVRSRASRTPILLYPGISPQWARDVSKQDLTITLSNVSELDAWAATSERLAAFVKVDLGFWRAGALPSEIEGLLDRAAATPNIDVKGLYAHLNELPGTGPTASEQWSRLKDLLATISRRPAIIMLSSSDGVLRHPEMDLDAVDPGAMLFGIADTARAARPLTLKPALHAIKARLVSVKRADASIGPVPDLPGYSSDMQIGVLGIGWGHGLPRDLPFGASAIIRGKRIPLLAPLHLEHVRVDLTCIPDAALGDEAILLGSADGEHIDLAELAGHWRTDSVGICCGLQPDLARVYTL